MANDINLLTIELKGRNLIEANAGTGKTYNITALFTRMIVEENILVESILVVTFTKAAVSDLKAKIYNRLNDVLLAMTKLQAGEKNEPSDDKFPSDYADHRKANLAEDIKRIKAALRDFDQCAIYTIHGFCQRMLKENAFSGNVAYDMEMTGDVSSILKKPVYDYWRRNVYGASEAVIPILANISPDDLIKFYKGVISNQSLEVLPPENKVSAVEIKRYQDELSEHAKAVKTCYERDHDEIHRLMDSNRKDFPLNRRSYSKKTIPKAFAELNNLIDTNASTPTKDIKRFTYPFMEDQKVDGLVIHSLFDLITEWFEKENILQQAIKDFINTFKFNLCTYMQDALTKYKNKHNIQSYDDLITSMRNAVLTSGLSDSGMTNSLRHKYQAALIDEFQDTDPYQYDIFNTVFGGGGKPFFMIGDPKQAIYSFRGADIFAYLKAAKSNAIPHTLTRNFRSDPELVEAVNSFFTSENAFLLKDIEYNPSVGADTETPVIVDGKKHAPVTIWETEKDNKQSVAEMTARSIAELLNKSESGNATIGGRKIQASDIAVICRSKDEMMSVKDALTVCRVPAVMSGSKNVFSTDEAKELANILSAVLHPFRQKDIKTALSTSVFGCTAEQIANIEEKDEWEEITEKFRSYNDLINLRGFAPMFFKIASDNKLYNKIAALPAGERKLTNMIHIAELAQSFEADRKAAPQDILRWLHTKIKDANNPKPLNRDEEAELKMDSDENAVTIITIHKSKGLEYNIVYTPFLMFSKGYQKDMTKYHDGDRFVMDLACSEQAVAKNQEEENAEKIRLAYVALTRAKALCITAWGEAYLHDYSPLAYLINGNFSQFDSEKFHSFFSGSKVQISEKPDTEPQIYTAVKNTPKFESKTFDKSIPAVWQLNSFSGLVHSSHVAKDTDQYTKPADAEYISSTKDIFTFPKGAKAGTCLHECMEDIHFEDFTKEGITKLVEEKLDYYSFDTDYTPAVTSNLYTIINKDMGGVKLCDLKGTDYVAEMEFQLATKPFMAKALADIFDKNKQTDYARAASTLTFETINGFLNGFADLIFCQGGKYYVLDWKSNHLGMTTDSYKYENMHAEMLSSHYYLQMHIYTLALHAYLSKALPEYSYEKHMGGGIYVFMRGVNLNGSEGLYIHKPSENIIKEMQELMTR